MSVTLSAFSRIVLFYATKQQAQVKLRIMRSVRHVSGLPVASEGTLDAAQALTIQVDTRDTDRCEYADPCDINAQCTDGNNGTECRCEFGFEGDGMSCTDLDECQQRSNLCHEHATCVNVPGSFQCVCNDGFVGDGYKSCEEFSLCSISQLFIPCHPLADCYGKGTFGIPTCVCKNGFQGDGRQTCTDVDECAILNGGCHQQCQNLIGTYQCICEKGYSIAPDNSTCLDVDECRDRNGGCNQICVNRPGGFQCKCRQGYQLSKDTVICEDVNECVIGNGACSHTCENLDGSYQCHCPENYRMMADAHNCQDVHCTKPLLIANAASTCTDAYSASNPNCSVSCEKGFFMSSNTLSCSVTGSFIGNAECHDVNECDDDNGGCEKICRNLPGDYQCECPANYELNLSLIHI
eukprot:TRINITY_DN68868_c0_g1_i1.p1 TRINITY_DN68868_c0_g1~~TRINITY_DN68868_c0_g1_i1.p1  ORF type:complete len:408 (+),score=40.58 TRINITY_DN68868_c0_g1_i1:634-1857(+)